VLHRVAVEKAKELGDSEAAHYLIARVGDSYRELYGDLDKALAAFEEALGLARQLKNVEREITMLGLVGAIRFEQGQEDGKKFLGQGYLLAKASHLDAARSRILQHLGYVACYEQDWEAARRYNLEAVSLVENSHEAEQRKNLFFSLLNLGEAELKLGHLNEALNACQQALTVSENQSNLLLTAYAFEGIAEIQHELGNRKLARESYQKALELFYENNAFSDREVLIETMREQGYKVNQNEMASV
jgi:tetratricopeptide (TPR) repeat protein